MPHTLDARMRVCTSDAKHYAQRIYIYVYTVPAHPMKNAPILEEKEREGRGKRRREKRSRRIVVEKKRKGEEKH